jgi:hypothetical protein
MRMQQCSETWAYRIHTPGNYPEENIQYTEHGESLKSSYIFYFGVIGKASKELVWWVMRVEVLAVINGKCYL